MTEQPPLFRMEGISKRYGGVRALEKAELIVEAGKVHAILGENGAGKSTLIKTMAGVVVHDEGRMLLDGREVTFADPAAANAAGIVCENGAGNSTLIKTMAGVVVPDEGRMLLDGREVTFADPAAANAAGIVCVFQELSLIPELSVADNIVVSNPPTRFGMIDRRAQRA